MYRAFFDRLFKKHESRIALALKRVANSDTATTRRQLYSALCCQRLLLPVLNPPESVPRDDKGRLLSSLQLSFYTETGHDGRKTLVLFTSPEPFDRWMKRINRPELKWIAIDTPSLCRLALDSGISAIFIVNDSQHAVWLDGREVRMMGSAEAGNPSKYSQGFLIPSKLPRRATPPA